VGALCVGEPCVGAAWAGAWRVVGAPVGAVAGWPPVVGVLWLGADCVG
jgi:hypothetical protein